MTGLDVHSPAAQAGIEQNDILVKLEDVALGKPSDLEDNLKAAGDKPLSLKTFARRQKPCHSGSAPRSCWFGTRSA